MEIINKISKEEKENNKACDVFMWRDLFNPNKHKLLHIPPWQNLPKDILIEVTLRVSPYEQFCIQATCKNWWIMLSDQNLFTHNRRIPWMMTWFGNCRTLRPQFRLYHPACKLPYRTDRMHGTPVERDNILAIKHGWILYYKKIKDLTKSDGTEYCFFLFSPFTQRRINLPSTKFFTFYSDVATFSSDPSSPNSIFLVRQSDSSKIYISMCRPHDTKWTTINKKGEFNESLTGVVCIGPFFYIITNCGTVVKCDVEGRCKFLVRLPLDRTVDWKYTRRSYVFEHRGEIILVYLYSSRWVEREDQCQVLQYIWSENVWEPLESIGERAIFIGVTSFIVSELGSLKSMSERIYYVDKNGNLKFFCLKDARSYSCHEGEEDFDCRGWLADNGKYRFFIEQP